MSAVLREYGRGTPTRLRKEGREKGCRSCWGKGILGEKGILVGGVWGMGWCRGKSIYLAGELKAVYSNGCKAFGGGGGRV